MYKNEIKEKYPNEKEQFAYAQGFEKALSYMWTYVTQYASQKRYSQFKKNELENLLMKATEESEQWLYHGLGIEEETE